MLDWTRRVAERTSGPRAYSLFDDVVPVLTALREEGGRQVIVSNHVPELAVIVAGSGIRECFADVITSGLVGYEKPHRQIFEAAVCCAIPGAPIWMIGDNVECDCHPVGAFGANAIRIRSAASTFERHAADLWQAAELIAGMPTSTLSNSLRWCSIRCRLAAIDRFTRLCEAGGSAFGLRALLRRPGTLFARLTEVVRLLPLVLVLLIVSSSAVAGSREDQQQSPSERAPSDGVVSAERIQEGLRRPTLEIPPLPPPPLTFRAEVLLTLETPLDVIRRELQEEANVRWRPPARQGLDLLPAIVGFVNKIKAIRRERSEADARRMVQQELAEFCKSHDCSDIEREPVAEGVILPQ